MKHNPDIQSQEAISALYPTWFRWNIIPIYNRRKPFLLYIPHGSDETHGVTPEEFINFTFISHMVQMKLQFHIHYPMP